jgi:hypothetical protein
MKVTEKTIILKILEGIHGNGWGLINGSYKYKNGSSRKTMVQPLIEYLRKAGLEIN